MAVETDLRVESGSPIFIVGCARSGTTLLRDLLRAHPRLTFPIESHFIPAFGKAYGDPRSAREAIRLARRILNFGWVRPWGLPLAPEDFTDCRSYRQVVCRLFEAWARQENKPRWGDKTPRYVLWIPELVALFPGAKIIHIYRDGRDVALSWLAARFGPVNLYMAAGGWKRRVRRGRQAGAALPKSSYLEVQYEQLLQQPRHVMERVCAFIGEPFDEAVLRPSRLAAPFRGTPPAFAAEIVSGNWAKWKTKMSQRDRILFESVAGDLLEELGYETEGRRRGMSALERGFWKAHHYAGRAVVRLASPSGPDSLRSVLQVWWALWRGGLRL